MAQQDTQQGMQPGQFMSYLLGSMMGNQGGNPNPYTSKAGGTYPVGGTNAAGVAANKPSIAGQGFNPAVSPDLNTAGSLQIQRMIDQAYNDYYSAYSNCQMSRGNDRGACIQAQETQMRISQLEQKLADAQGRENQRRNDDAQFMGMGTQSSAPHYGAMPGVPTHQINSIYGPSGGSTRAPNLLPIEGGNSPSGNSRP